MNVLLVSQCSKRALAETRRILDQFAERRGEGAWQTPITLAGLETLRRLLRKTARKNTSVACHWIRGANHSELLWIVGDASRFNAYGAVPTNTTKSDVLRRAAENTWHSLRDIRLITGLAALLHDLGKACKAFQERLRRKTRKRNLYRHEWISLRLFQAFVGSDDDATWLSRLAALSESDDSMWFANLQKDGLSASNAKPFTELPPLAQAIAWLILSHHRLPLQLQEGETFRTEILDALPGCITAHWNEYCAKSTPDETLPYWIFQEKLPATTVTWRKKAAQLAEELGKGGRLTSLLNTIADPYMMHLARLSLMLADHAYSSRTDSTDVRHITSKKSLFANTDSKNGALKQLLDEHLLGVEKLSGHVTRLLPRLHDELPRLARHKGLGKRGTDERFRWQDKAAEVAASIRERSSKQGAFIINMASTGCGKTLANAKVMYALADPAKGMRCAFALGLRTLTLQTGYEYRRRLLLGDDEVAIRIGGSAVRKLFDHYREQAESSGSASVDSLLPEDAHVLYEGNPWAYPALTHLLNNPHVQSLLLAPMFVCTIDHLIPATESTRGGHQIVPMLRLLSGDLVLDELDDYDIKDLPAVTRLVFWAGMLGSRVLLSSATLPPALAQGMFDAYRQGRHYFQRNRGERPGETPDICCAWIDESGCMQQDCGESQAFAALHTTYTEKRCAHLAKAPPRRHGELVAVQKADTPQQARAAFACQSLQCALRLHGTHHSIDAQTGKRVSFGLIRMANIEPMFDVALALYELGVPEQTRVHLCVYHSRYPLLLRSAIEQNIDAALDRRNPETVFKLPAIRSRLEQYHEPDQLFIVLGSPVTEVGRDHDYDWAVVEPSSMRSLIQLAGRVRRHREPSCAAPNMLIFERNLKSIEKPGQLAYRQPGFEGDGMRLAHHSLGIILGEEALKTIDARPRIVARSGLQPEVSLIDLEHARLAKTMLAPERQQLTDREKRLGIVKAPPPGAYSFWAQPKAALSGMLQKEQRFRVETENHVELALLPDETEEDYVLTRLFDPEKNSMVEVPVENLNHRVPESRVRGNRILPWGVTSYMAAVKTLAHELDMDLTLCAKRFGTVTLPENTHGWHFHPALGFNKAR